PKPDAPKSDAPKTEKPPAPSAAEMNAATKDWNAIKKFNDSRDYKALATAINAFNTKYGAFPLATEKSAEIKSMSENAPVNLGLDKGLLAHWTFTEGGGATAADSSGNGNNGTLVKNGAWGAGKAGGALTFSGKEGYMDYGNKP